MDLPKSVKRQWDRKAAAMAALSGRRAVKLTTGAARRKRAKKKSYRGLRWKESTEIK